MGKVFALVGLAVLLGVVAVQYGGSAREESYDGDRAPEVPSGGLAGPDSGGAAAPSPEVDTPSDVPGNRPPAEIHPSSDEWRALRGSLVPLAMVDPEGRTLRSSMGLPLTRSLLLLPFSHLNGASEVRRTAGSGGRESWHVVGFDRRAFAVLSSDLTKDRTSWDLAIASESPTIGARLVALSVDPVADRPVTVAGNVTATEERSVVLAGGALFERFVIDDLGRLVGVGADSTENGAEVLTVATIRDVLEADRVLTLPAMQGLFEGDANARRERGVLYAALEEWSAATDELLAALRLDPGQRELCEDALLTVLHMSVQESARGRSADELLARLEESARALYGNAEVRELWGLVLLDRGEPEEALEVLLEAASLQRHISDRTSDRLRSAYLRAGERARADGRLDQATALLQDAVGRYPDDILLLKSLGYVLFESGDDLGALDLLQRVAALDSGQAAALDSLITRLQDRLDRPQATEIRFDPRGGAIRTRASINGARQVSVLVDTGATLTVISRQVADELGLSGRRANRTVEVVTANGRVRAPMVLLDHVDLQGAVRRSIEAVVLDLDDSGGSEALIGLNFLNAFEVGLDSERGLLRLTPIR